MKSCKIKAGEGITASNPQEYKLVGCEGFETYKINEQTIGVRPIWKNAKTNPPKEKGRYLILTTFVRSCVSLDCIVREDVPFVSNYLPGKGWLSKCDEHEITHWMEIPPRV